MRNRFPKHRRGVSPVIATLLLIIIALAAGGMTWVVVKSQTRSLSPGAGIEVTDASLVKASNVAVASATVQNTGSKPLTSVSVKINVGGTQYSLIDQSGISLEPGQTISGDNSAIASADVVTGDSYPLQVNVTASDGSNVTRSTSVTARSS